VAYFNGLVTLDNATDQRGYDAAITSFKSILDPDKQPRERNFDFTKDYVVINALGRALFERATLERGNPAARDPFLLEAIEQYERTLSLEPEDLMAHYGLHQCFQMLGRPMSKLEHELPEKTPKTDEASLQELARTLLDGKADTAARREAAIRLVQGVTALGAEPLSVTQPKRPRFQLLLAQIQPSFQRENDREMKMATAYVLGALHRELYAIFKPDDIAESRAMQAYRSKHLAANRAAEAIVIYPLKRD
jgi:hypothetical protein